MLSFQQGRIRFAGTAGTLQVRHVNWIVQAIAVHDAAGVTVDDEDRTAARGTNNKTNRCLH